MKGSRRVYSFIVGVALIVVILSFSTVGVFAVSAEPFAYIHDPTENETAMRDIVKDETAIYGFRPNETGSLKQYASVDWSDAEVVAKGRLERIAYHESLSSLYDILYEMQADNKDVEEIARTVSERRNELRLEAVKDNPDEEALLRERNLEKYGHEEGPLPDELYEKYGSWEAVLEKAFNSNVGMDACLGLYDDYYPLYVSLGQVEDIPYEPDSSFEAKKTDAKETLAIFLSTCGAAALLVVAACLICFSKKKEA